MLFARRGLILPPGPDNYSDMKYLHSLIVALLGTVLFYGCGEDPVVENPVEPELLSISPEDGSTDIEGPTLAVTLKFDRNMKTPKLSSLKLDPEAVISSVETRDKGIFVNLAELVSGETYSLVFPVGTIVSYGDEVTYSKEVAIHFTMKEKEYSGERYGIGNVTQSLSDPKAGDPARRLYSYLLDCYGSKTLSGAMGGTAWETTYTDYIYSQTGSYPAIVGFDYLHNNWVRSPYWGPDYSDITPVKNAWEAHNIIQIGWHWNAATSESVAHGTTISDGDFSYSTKAYSITEALKEGTWQHDDLIRQLDQVAGYLKILQDAGIPVLWRPLHEAAGDYTWGAWFWWGYGGSEPCKQLWRYMYKLFTEEYGLHNLIWVWTVQTSSAGKLASVTDLQAWYPGDEYVDIVGGDFYDNKWLTHADRFQLINDSVKGRKMVTVSEFGNLLDIDGYFAEGAPWLYFLNWNNYVNNQPVLYADSWNNSVDDWKKVLGNPHTINREQVPELKSYTSPDVGWEKASEAVVNMKTGWNLGNTLDTCGDWLDGQSVTKFETGWGQPVTKAELMKMFADAGFGAIRVPVTWYQHMDADGNIDESWMKRVEEVVNYVLDAGMYCILNVHHDTGTDGWLHADATVYNATKDRFIVLWRQIAERFKNYGSKLLFESFNEMLDAGNNWNAPKSASSYTYIDNYNQDFVNTVRATGGNNAYRNLVINDYCASSTPEAFEALNVPEDSAKGHLIAEFHSYSPYSFAMDESASAQTTWTTSAENEIQNQIKTIARLAATKGVPVIIGEYGATAERNESEIAKQCKCYVQTCKQYGMACFCWMLLSDGADRSVPKWSKSLIKDAIINASK